MTLTEIEETLNTLEQRHSGFNEGMLVTLLRAGGWEEKQIKEAQTVFRLRSNIPTQSTQSALVSLPKGDEVPLFMPTVDGDHLLEAHPLSKGERIVISEPQSVVTHSVVTQVVTKETKKEELPHNLPLRPFETSEHIWPFSRYRDIFYGDGHEEGKEETKIETTEIKTNYIVAPQPHSIPPKREEKVPPQAVERVAESIPQKVTESVAEKITERVPERFIEKPVEKERSFAPSPSTALSTAIRHAGDEKIIILACIMLLVILLLLGYMYSNGRL